MSTTMTEKALGDASTADGGKPTFTFLHLPLELRIQIYHELLVSPFRPHDTPLTRRRLIEAFSTSSSSTSSTRISHVHPSILRTCKRINAEASPILYKLNTFTAHPSLLTAYPSFLEPGRALITQDIVTRRAIRRWHVTVRLDCDARFTSSALKAAFDGADELSVAASEAMYRSSGLHNVLLFANVRGVRRARVSGSVDARVARWLEQVMCSPEGQDGVPLLEEWMQSASTVFGGVLSERDDRFDAAKRAGAAYNTWQDGNR